MPRHLAPVRPHWPRLRWGATGHHRAPDAETTAINADERLEVLLPWTAVRDENGPDALRGAPGTAAARGAR
jgi:hypothetical protein